MMPGMGGRMDPRRMNQMMKSLGIHVEDIEGVEEVVIRTRDKEYRFERPSVTMMDAKGQKTYQVVGNPKVTGMSIAEQAAKEGHAAPAQVEISDEDVQMVAEQTGVPKDKAKKALKDAGGDIAEAILKLSG